MGYLDQYVNLNPQIGGGGIAGTLFPVYESTVPQYPYPNPYNLAQLGYRRNELIYACTNKRAKAIAEAPLRIYDDSGETPEDLADHPLRKVLKGGPNRLSEQSFWQATETFLCSAGFAAWEIEFNRMGEPMTLWPMLPDWCAFRRGGGKPIEVIRYQVPGLAYQDVPIENVLLFQYFDPTYPLLKALGPTAVASRVTSVDNSATDFLKIFFERGAIVNGLLKTDQSLSEAAAKDIRRRWMEQHGGIGNWAEVAVLGQGVSYQQMQMNFREMQFEGLDGRDEARICMAFEMPPILLGAKVGLDASTYSNYKEARSAWYEEWTSPEWKMLASQVDLQLMPHFDEAANGSTYLIEFDLNEVKALQEDRTAKWTRAIEAAKANVITRNMALDEMGLDPIDIDPDTGEQMNVFVGITIRENPAVPVGHVVGLEDVGIQENPSEPNPPDATAQAAKALERKQFRLFAAKRIKDGHPEEVGKFLFKFLNHAERKALIEEALPDAKSGASFRQVAYP